MRRAKRNSLSDRAISKVVIAQEEIIPVSEDADSIVGEGEDEIEPVSKP